MNKIDNELTKKFFQNKYPMSTGSYNWRDIKGDYELIDDAVAGTVAHEDYNKSLGREKIKELQLELEKFKVRVINYESKDEVENKEKEIIQNKIDAGLEIYKAILTDYEPR